MMHYNGRKSKSQNRKKINLLCNMIYHHSISVVISVSDSLFMSLMNICLLSRLVTTAGCVGRTATVRNSGSSTSPQRSIRTACSTRRTTRTAGSIASLQGFSKSVIGEFASNLHHPKSDKNPGRVFDKHVFAGCRFLKGTCSDEERCTMAHGEEELKEWMDRREFLLMKLAKARNDHLISPNDNDFGKYSFLLKDIK